MESRIGKKRIRAPHKRWANRIRRRNDAVSVLCPVCWQTLTLSVDRSAGEHQSFVQDCEVCCRPLVVTIRVDEDISAEAVAE